MLTRILGSFASSVILYCSGIAGSNTKLSPAFSDEKDGLLLFSSSISHLTSWSMMFFNSVSFTLSASSLFFAGSSVLSFDVSAISSTDVLSLANSAVSFSFTFADISVPSCIISLKLSSSGSFFGIASSLLLLFLSTMFLFARTVSSTETANVFGNITADKSSPCRISCFCISLGSEENATIFFLLSSLVFSDIARVYMLEYVKVNTMHRQKESRRFGRFVLFIHILRLLLFSIFM